MRIIILALAIMATSNLTAFSQDVQNTKTENQSPDSIYSYAYISVERQILPTRLKVEVDFGDAPEQLEAGKEYSRILTGKKSYAAILNYMASKQFELVGTLGLTYSYQGSGGNSGVVFIMKKRK